MARLTQQTDDALSAARAAQLHHVRDDRPGITRRPVGGGFSYRDPDGRRITDRGTLERIRRLAIPPAWRRVWICPDPSGHIQATGRDARGRKQYRYHARWRQVRDATKYHRLIPFARALPAIRSAVDADLGRTGLPRERALAAVVWLLEHTLIRIGNQAYARDNGSYGLTTMRDNHVRFAASDLTFTFQGKSGRRHRISLRNRRLARLVKMMRDLPGQELFQYLGDDGQPTPIGSTDVNAYLRRISGDDFSAKDFRTWAGTLLAAQQLPTAAADPPSLAAAMTAVAERLGNTPAVCRRCYVDPVIIGAFSDPAQLARWQAARARHRDGKWLSRDEAALVEVLEHRGDAD